MQLFDLARAWGMLAPHNAQRSQAPADPLTVGLAVGVRHLSAVLLSGLLLACSSAIRAEEPAGGLEVYGALKRFQLSGATAAAENLVVQYDRVKLTFDGRFYFETQVAGRVRGAVFQGRGVFQSQAPPEPFERENLQRMLKADTVESDFQTAVLRFTDDTFERIGSKLTTTAGVPAEAQRLASEFEPRLLRETGINVSSRLAVSILNAESPGFFLTQLDRGRRGRFVYVLDHQGRVPVAAFEVNAGEKGLIFAHRGPLTGNDIWMAFFSLADYEHGQTSYSDSFDLAVVARYAMELDVRDPKHTLKILARLDFISLADGLRALPLALNQSLPEQDSLRLKKALRLKSARWADGASLEAAQEDWDGSITLFLGRPRSRGEEFTAVLELEGDFLYDSPFISDVYYPRATGHWYPRHGYLNRSTFDLTFRHKKKYRVAAPGVRVREEAAPDKSGDWLTQWRMDKPVALVTFGVGPFESHFETVKAKDWSVPLEFFSMPGSRLAIKEDFILAELNNCVQYFAFLFGPYPYPRFGALYHPRGFGQGFASLLLLPATDSANPNTFAFIAHETAHQWWGNIVAWRSYRDQWLSEGFAEYSGILYAGFRERPAARKQLLERMRASLKDPPETEQGIGRGRLADVGPVLLGHRLSTRETQNAYTTLIYNKGALILRMLHFLFSDPGTGNGQPFWDMMQDFVRRHRDGWATTESFRLVANEHFTRTPIARKYGLKDLDWFFSQWVHQAHLPSYRLAYKLDQADGSVVLKGTLYQENAPDNWFMPLPLMFKFGGKSARGAVHAFGPETAVTIKLPARPDSVELDPEMWVLSAKTSTTTLK